MRTGCPTATSSPTGPAGHAVLIDTEGPTGPILEKVTELRLTVSHVLCTHHHVDHIAHNADYKARFGCPVCGHGAERELFGGLDVETRATATRSARAACSVRAIHVPGHTQGQLAYLVNDERVFTGDTLFRESVGGTRAPGHGTFEELRHSIMEVLMRLRRGHAGLPRAHRPHHDRRGVGAKSFHPRLARSRCEPRNALHRVRRAPPRFSYGHGITTGAPSAGSASTRATASTSSRACVSRSWNRSPPR